MAERTIEWAWFWMPGSTRAHLCDVTNLSPTRPRNFSKAGIVGAGSYRVTFTPEPEK
jgi:hypothetical protein